MLSDPGGRGGADFGEIGHRGGAFCTGLSPEKSQGRRCRPMEGLPQNPAIYKETNSGGVAEWLKAAVC